MNGRSLGRSLALIGLALLISGCASMRGPGSQGQRLDPWEKWNRRVFSFNEAIDENLLKPVATVYSELVPSTIRQGVDNFFGHINDAWSTINLLLQGRPAAGVQQGMRVAVNSVLGFGGVLDIGTEVGLERNSQDMGKTFGRWGFRTGAYIVWPLFGPSSVRDSLGVPFARLASPSWVVHGGSSKTAVFALQTVNARSNFLRAGEMLEGIALDKYTFYRDAYLQRRGSFDDDEEFEVLVPDEPPAVKNPQAGP